ncbi:isoprenylcysteine carboxylmethyltransferase family protein [Rhodohalobacter sp.]|uniref:isoprenylcysteine carboxylmethyltransferase family protein n=1 Tax=Rhodohalobacter sp. TaxID=1974210 RepID=UPI002ACD7487|nr:isoprenylcysteine carboxylmethyltransferase family protein [Rhodohalobacter sp.]MDZ7755589.1 isoprenylcysteine carboxylmethyltransferase family protein [Rhodohalobacter sp.]
MTEHLADYLIPTIIFLAFALMHSITASHSFKAKLFRLSPNLKAWYRALYNLVSIVIIGLWWITLPQDSILYQLNGFPFFLLIALQIVFAWLFLKSIFAQNGMVFLGIKQVLSNIREGKLPNYLDEPQRGKLVTTGLYRYMRHPMYTFAMLVLICSPVMTANLLYTIIIFALYFWIGSYFEEKNLTNRFGEDYREYQKNVPRFIPHPFK